MGAKSVSRPYFSIKSKIVILFLLVSSLLIMTQSVLSFVYGKAGLEKRILSDLGALVEIKAASIATLVEEDIEDARDISSRRILREALQGARDGIIDSSRMRLKVTASVKDAEEVMPTVRGADIISREGIVIASTIPGNTGKDVSGDDCFIKGKTGPYMCEPYYSKGTFIYEISAPVYGTGAKDKDVIGVARIMVNEDRINNILVDYTGLGDTGETVLGKRIEDDMAFLGNLRNRGNNAFPLRIPVASTLANPMRFALNKGVGITIDTDYRGKEVLAAYHYIPISDWGIVVKIDREEAFKPIHELFIRIVIVDCVLFFLSALMIMLLAKFITDPLKGLRLGTMEIASGNLGYRVKVFARDEVGELAESFNKMADSLKEVTVSRDRLNEEIDQRKKVEEALKEYALEVRDLYNNAPCGYHSLDKDGVFVRINDTELRWLGYSREEMVGKKIFSDIITSQSLAMFRKTFSEFKERGWAKDLEFDMVRKDGTVMSILLNAIAIKDKDGNYIMSRSTILDNTERKTADEARREAMDAKSRFTSMVSHELRTPLAAIKEGISIVTDGIVGKISGDQMSYLSIAKSNVDRLTRLINDILDFQKLQSGKLALKMEEGSITEIAGEVCKTMTPLAEQKGITLKFRAGKDMPLIRFDHDKIEQVLVNLINNAIKFTQKGGVEIAINMDKGSAHVVVSDTGVGIKEQDMPRLFRSFEQLEDAVESKGGTGLGLAISKEIVELHKGTIWAESEHGNGTKIHFKLPV